MEYPNRVSFRIALALDPAARRRPRRPRKRFLPPLSLPPSLPPYLTFATFRHACPTHATRMPYLFPARASASGPPPTLATCAGLHSTLLGFLAHAIQRRPHAATRATHPIPSPTRKGSSEARKIGIFTTFQWRRDDLRGSDLPLGRWMDGWMEERRGGRGRERGRAAEPV